jgi:hypothetical protein
MAAAIIPQAIGVVDALGSFLGGSNKNALRDQQEKDRLARAQGGSVSDAQGIYHDSLPQNKQPAERIKDDQAAWSTLQAAGWTVDTGGTVHPPSTGRAAGGWSAALTGGAAAAAPGANGAGGTIASVASGHAVAFAVIGVVALLAIVFMLRGHFK